MFSWIITNEAAKALPLHPESWFHFFTKYVVAQFAFCTWFEMPFILKGTFYKGTEQTADTRKQLTGVAKAVSGMLLWKLRYWNKLFRKVFLKVPTKGFTQGKWKFQGIISFFWDEEWRSLSVVAYFHHNSANGTGTLWIMALSKV